VDDLPEVRGTLYAAPILARGPRPLHGVDASAALALPGVRGVVLAADIPGDPILAAFGHDEPIFAQDTVQHRPGDRPGRGRRVMAARRAARKVQCDITPLPALLNVHDAHRAQSYVLPPVHARGDAAAGLARAGHRLQGTLEVGGRSISTWKARLPTPCRWSRTSGGSTPAPSTPARCSTGWHALGIGNHAVVECRRMGGGFGGKETQSGHLAVWAALAARKFNAPVKLRLDRDDDFMVTGKRHPFAYDYDVGFDDTGRITGLQLQMLANCGFSADLSGPVADRAIFHADNAYFLRRVHQLLPLQDQRRATRRSAASADRRA
jgi:xanthine dehydrogenase large subunit